MRVLFFKPFLGIGGETRWVFEVGQRLAKRGHEITILFSESLHELLKGIFPHLTRSINKIKIQATHLPLGNPIPLNPFRLKRLFNNFDVVYFHHTPPNDFLISIIKAKVKVSMIEGLHRSLKSENLVHSVYFQTIMKHTFKTFHAFHVLNNYVACFLKNQGCKNVYVIPNGVDTKLFSLCKHPANFNSFNVLYTGRLTKNKGIDILLKIIRCIHEKLSIRDIKFTICGSGQLEDMVKEVAQNYENVRCLGFVPPNSLTNIYKEAHVFIIPSRTEGMPLSLLEAQSCGLPVVGSNIPGVKDVVLNEKTGILTRVGDVKGLVEGIKKYYELWRNSPDEYYSLCKKIRAHITKNYDWAIIIERLENMLKEVSRTC